MQKGQIMRHDGVYYENIIHGGELVIIVITKLFNKMTEYSHIPIDLKKGCNYDTIQRWKQEQNVTRTAIGRYPSVLPC